MNLTYEQLSNHGQTSQTQLGTAYASSTTLTDVSPGGNTAGQAFTFGAGQLRVGQSWRVRAKGIISNTGTPTLLMGLYYGGIAGTALAATTALATVTGLSNNVWSLEADFRVEAEGTNGGIRTLGVISGPFASPPTFLPASSSSGNLVSSLDTSSAKVLSIGAQWGTSSASNTLQVVMFMVERLNEGGS